MIKKYLSIIWTLLVCLCFVSCKSNGKTVIKVCEVTHSVFYAPLYVAINKGYFEEENLEIELVNGNGADKVMTALLSKDAHIGLMGMEASIYVYVRGQENYALNFAQLTRTDGSFVFGREKEDFTLDSLKGKTILGGRKGGMPEMTLEYVLKQNGLLVGRDDESVLEKGGVNVRTDIQFSAMAGAYTSGEGDYTTLFEPTATTLENEEKGYVLKSVGSYIDDIPYTCFCALKDYIDNNEEKIIKFVRALKKGVKWVLENESEEVAKELISFFPSNTINELTKVTKRHKEINAWKEDLMITREAFDLLQEIMIEAGELTLKQQYENLVITKYK